MSSARLEAFSDGVFAVAITLLALDLRVDGPGHGTLAHQLAHQWPSFAAYVVSFFVIGIVWVNHHALFTSFARADRSLMFLNLLLLLWIVAIPFATSTMATYLRRQRVLKDAELRVDLPWSISEPRPSARRAIVRFTIVASRSPSYYPLPRPQRRHRPLLRLRNPRPL